ncbi:predicted protein [Chaetoceros tenuissimus]|uniref:Uncharacterized protein n=1 Tax=Chaetoceros tenuissimus TaxID=426638 RepID=A0AAD3CGC8_9STRA|nr:predicted protein [Chaetoceros tenuissimus]
MLQTKKRSYRSTVHPYYSTGIPELESESLHSSEDDPDLFFDEQCSSDVEDDKMGHESAHLDENLVDHLDGEQISVHSSHSCVSYQEIDPDEHDTPEDSIHAPLEKGLPSSSVPQPDPRTSSASSKQLKSSRSSKSWEGSEIVLNESSFVIDSSILRNLQQEMENCNLQDHFEKNGKDRKSPTSVRDYLSTSSPRSITNTKALDQDNCDMKLGSIPVTSSVSYIPEEANLDTYPVKVAGKKTGSEYQRANSGSNANFDTPKKENFARRWSFSSSVAEEDENEEEMDSFNPEPSYRPFSAVSSYKSHSRSRSSSTRSLGSNRHRPTSAKSSSSSVVSESLEKQELFLKLSDEDDLKDFKHINNFTYEGDYLFSRILRERTRIELKRQMLSTPDKELYVETAKSEWTKRETESSCSESVYGDRSVYFMI